MARQWFSFSKMEKYLRCSWWYYLRHIKGIFVETDSVATVAGTIAHDTLEMFYDVNGVNRTTPVEELLSNIWINKLIDIDALHLFDALQTIAADVAQMYVRAGSTYRGLDAIVDDKGKAFSKPASSNAWKLALKKLNLPIRQAEIDAVAKASGVKPWGTVSLSAVFAETHTFMAGYVDHITANGLSVLSQELPLSMPAVKGGDLKDAINMVYYPNGNVYCGYLDMIATDEHGRIYIIDHKTSKDAPTSAKVAHWEQLLLYAWAHFELWGRWPDFIAINHIRTKQLIIAKFDESLINDALDRAMAIHDGIERQVFIQVSPTAYGSQCWNDYKRTPCEFLQNCHPAFYKIVTGGGQWVS